MTEMLIPQRNPVVAGPPTAGRPRGRGHRARGRARAIIRVAHRRTAIVLGLLVLTMTTSGSLLLFKGEIDKLARPAKFHATRSAHPISPQRALATVQRARPQFGATSVNWNQGVWEVPSKDGTRFVTVDPGTGRILGERGEIGFFAFLENLHTCTLTCKDLPGYVKALDEQMPDLGIPGIAKLTIGTFITGVAALVLLFLVLGGLILWWPGIRRWRRGFQVRASKGRYARNHDLHKLVGFAALPFLAMWALTGANFQLPIVHDVSDALLPGSTPAKDAPKFASLPVQKGTADIGVERAEAAALSATHGGRIVKLRLPEADDAKAAYEFCIDKGFNWYRADQGCPGAKRIAVDRHDSARAADTKHSDNLAQLAFGKQTKALHFGVLVGWIPRLLLCVMGLVPLLLAFTGMSTWRHRRAKRRAAARAGAAPKGVPAP